MVKSSRPLLEPISVVSQRQQKRLQKRLPKKKNINIDEKKNKKIITEEEIKLLEDIVFNRNTASIQKVDQTNIDKNNSTSKSQDILEDNFVLDRTGNECNIVLIDKDDNLPKQDS